MRPSGSAEPLATPRRMGIFPARTLGSPHMECNARMEPMFLPGVESKPDPGTPYTKLIQQMSAAGQEYPQIWHLFAFKPHATEHLARFTQEILRGEAPLSPGFRELIAARTSARNDCPF